MLAVLSMQALGQSILFVGNSLTYSNDLPRMVEKIGKTAGIKLKTRCLCFPNYGLEDHWTEGKVSKLIEKEEFDFVVFQQGPSSQAYGRSSLIDFGGRITELAESHDTKAAYFMVWPSLQYYHTFAGVIKNHSDAAKQSGAMLIPAGEHWKAYREVEGLDNLYGPDGFHPSKTGSFLAALTIISTLFPDIELNELRYQDFDNLLSEKAFIQMIDLLD